MTNKEHRSTTRLIATTQPKGRMYMVVRGERIRVQAVRNLSAAGTSVLMDGDAADFGEALPVALEYQADDGEVTVNGNIVWSRPSESPADQASDTPTCVLGISLLSPHLLLVFYERAGIQSELVVS